MPSNVPRKRQREAIILGHRPRDEPQPKAAGLAAYAEAASRNAGVWQ
jgi:hypothetical protein